MFTTVKQHSTIHLLPAASSAASPPDPDVSHPRSQTHQVTINGKGAALASREIASVGHHHHCHHVRRVFLFKARRVCLHCGTWPLFPHARRCSQTWPATGLDPPSTRSQPPQRTGSSGMCSSSRTWTTKARTRGTQLDSSRASRRVRVTFSISSGSKTCHSCIGS